MFSVVIPLYNKEDCVLKTLNSVLCQTYHDFEIIMVDDGSTDNSLITVSSINDDRMRVFSKPNGGPSSARNFGIKESKGDYIAFIDADDLWSPDFLFEMKRLISDYPDADIYGFNYGIIEQGKPVAKETACFRGYVSDKWDCFPLFYFSSACCCNADAIRKVGGFDERIFYGEDLDVWYRLLLNGRGVLDSRIMAYYFKDANNSLTQHSMPLEKHLPYFMEKYEEARQANAGFRKFFDEQMVYRLYPYLFDNKYRKEALRLSKMIDYSLLKNSMRFRMNHPYIYRFLKNIRKSDMD